MADDLDSEGAEELESQWIAQESETLVNWVNLGRKTDYAALERFHRLRDTNRKRIADAKELEKSDPEQVVQIYFETIEAIAEYANIHAEEGLVGNLLAEEKQEIGIKGEVMALDRLTLCLCRLGRKAEAAKAAEEYFYSYQADLQLGVATRIMKRVGQDQRNDG